jgi:hypothetical protein
MKKKMGEVQEKVGGKVVIVLGVLGVLGVLTISYFGGCSLNFEALQRCFKRCKRCLCCQGDATATENKTETKIKV